MKSFEQRKYLSAATNFVIKQYLYSEIIHDPDASIKSSKVISGAAGLISQIVVDNNVLKEHLVSSLTRSIIPSLDDSLAARRAVIAALARDEGRDMSPPHSPDKLTSHRELTHAPGELHKALRRLHIHQTHANSAARRYECRLQGQRIV